MDPELLIAVDDARLDLGEGHQEEQQDASIDQVGLGVTVDRVHTELIRDDVSVISRASSRSSSKSVTSERSKRLAKLAAIDVQRKFLEREKQQEKAAKLYEIEHSNAAKLLEMEKEAAVAMAELAVFDQFVDEIPDFSNLPQAGPLTSETVPTVLPVQQYQHADPSATDLITRSRNVLNIVDNISSVNSNTANTAVIATANNVMRTDFDQNKITLNSWPKPNLPASNQESNQSILDLSNVLKSHNLPKIELATFNGNPIEFYNWLTTFEQIIEDGTTDPTKRLHYLKQYTSGDANTLVSGFSLYGSSDGYNLAKAELIKEFGNPNVIARSFIDKIEKFKNISSNDNVSMRAFSILLKSCRGSMATSKHLQQLNTDFYLQKVVAKLAVPLQVSWRHHVHRLESNGDVADFNELVKFIDREATVCNHPVYSTCALNPSSTNNHMSKSNVKVAKVAATTAVESKRKPSCPKCSSTHDLEECREYLGLSLDERKKFLIQKHLCFGCLKLTSRSHSVKTCRYKKKCGECSRLHPTSLHDKQFATKSKESKETEPKVVSCLTEVKTQSEKILLSVVLVKLRYENKEVITYAALDSMSSASFISKELWQKIDCPGRKTEITVKTVNGEMKQESAVVTNLSVSSVNATKEISLPSLYVQNSLPIETSDIVSHDILMSYPQLQHLCDEICDLNPSIPIGLLIGVNCPKALEPTQCISSGMYGPCAIKTILGWCVSGPVNSSRSRTTSNNALICNFTSCRDSVLNVKESELPEMIQRMYEYDFVESSISPHLLTGAKTDVSESECEKALSCNDRKFIRLMQNSVRQVNGHYELPLPLIDQSLPNNKVQALKRLRGLRQRFDKDEKYKNDYICFMNEMLEKGYATKSSDEISNSWYIPHHGVYHPRKPNKVRVVFDCSAHHMNTSLNKSLLSGPDLTNSLVGVLLRFRQESIAIMADIESMFYQVKVPEQQQNYLRYLWWPDGDTSKSPEDYQMTVHLFGATSSPSCANFALRQAASDYSSVYGKEAASTLTNNFYVDDMLKSVKDPQTAIKLIKSVKEMCKAGGFHLTKFMCNNGDVLNSVPVEDRAKSVTDVNLIGAASQIETVLGVCWCINNDTLSFRIHLKDSPLTRRGILSTVSSVYDPLGFAAPFLLQGKLLLQELCQKNMGWDDVLDDDTCSKWEKWRKKLSLLQNININRCFKPTEFGNIVSVSVHNFADASQKAYGCCSYLRLVDEDGRIHCSLIMGKSRVAPSKPITIPRLELVAATVAVKINKFVCRELEYKKHPIVLPRNHHITEILVRHYHVKAGHSGKELVMSHIRERFWILGARRIIRQIQNQCFTCRKLYSKPLIQRMADLPTDRLEAEKPPFSSVGVDFFGPFIVKSGRNQLKRYGCIFTCLAIRAVHIEVTFSLETDSFINALQRFISRRGQPHIIRSDNGTNLVGAERELKAAVKEWNSSKMQEFMRQEQIDWKFNPPTASHMGGVWERQIRTTRKILSALMNQQPLTDETLPTLMCIVENIINSRPISPVSDDPNDLEALTPNHLLQPRNDVKLPPGNFYQHDIYSRKRWRQVQYLANVFWSRWKAEYLPTLQSRAKWLKPERNLQINDIVLIKEDNLPRFQWLLGRVLNVTMGSDGLVRSAEVKTNSGEFLRPVHKLCLLECCVSSD